jgi:hypothetical protein
MPIRFSPKLTVKLLLNIGVLFSIFSLISCSSANISTSAPQPAPSATVQLNQAETSIAASPSEAASQEDATSVLSTESPSSQSQPNTSLKIAIQPIVQIDPAFISSDSEVLLANLVYDYLIDTDADGKFNTSFSRIMDFQSKWNSIYTHAYEERILSRWLST